MANFPTTTNMNPRTYSRKQVALTAGMVLAVLACLAYGYRWWTVDRFIESTDDAYVGANVTQISPHVGGFVASIAVGDNQYVRAGQLLIRIAPADFEAVRAGAAAAVQRELAVLQSLRARIALQHTAIRQAAADLSSRRAAFAFAREDAKRYSDLSRTRAGSGRDAQRARTKADSARFAVVAAQAQLDAARKGLAVLAASVQETRSALLQAQAQLHSAELDIGYTELRSPIDGYVGDRSAQVGAYVSTGSQLMTIVPAHGLWVDANFKEDQIRAMHRGQEVSIFADADPGHEFHGRLSSLAPATGSVFSVIPPQNATGNFTKIVQRVPVRISLDGTDGTLGLLRPGLSVTASVNTHSSGSTR